MTQNNFWLKFHIGIEGKQARALVSYVQEVTGISMHLKKYKRAAEAILGGLTTAWDHGNWIIYSATREDFNIYAGSVNQKQLFNPTKQIIGSLQLQGYIEHKSGDNLSRMSSMFRPTDKFYQDFISRLTSEEDEWFNDRQAIILRRKVPGTKKKVSVNYDIKRERLLKTNKNIRALNTILSNTIILYSIPYKETFSCSKSINSLKVDSNSASKTYGHNVENVDKKYSRIFTENFNSGGRYYSIMSNMPKTIRETLTFNGETTVELDYSGLHLSMIYNMSGLEAASDPYDIGTDEFERSAVKTATLIALNAGTLSKAIGACVKEEIVSGILDKTTGFCC